MPARSFAAIAVITCALGPLICSRPIAAQPATRPRITVDAAGGGDFTTLNAAVRAAAPGTILFVRNGTYEEVVVLDRNIELQAESPAAILQARGVTPLVVRTDEAVIRGLSIRLVGTRGTVGAIPGTAVPAVLIPQGKARLSGCDVTSDLDACILVTGQATLPLIEDCTIHDGNAAGFRITDGARPRILRSQITRCTNAGVRIESGADPLLQECRISEGQKNGIYVLSRGRGTARNCEIWGNAHANVEARERSIVSLQECRIRQGHGSGIKVHESSSISVDGCDILSNAAAGIEIGDGGTANVRGCRIQQNSRTGILARSRGTGSFTDCDLTGNGPAGKTTRELAAGARVQFVVSAREETTRRSPR